MRTPAFASIPTGPRVPTAGRRLLLALFASALLAALPSARPRQSDWATVLAGPPVEDWDAWNVTGGFLAYGRSEEGGDRNGDGDGLDAVLHLWDAELGVERNLGLAITSDLLATDGFVLFQVSEADQGGEDLNGDRDAEDDVLGIVECATGKVVLSPVDGLAPVALARDWVLATGSRASAFWNWRTGEVVDLAAHVFPDRELVTSDDYVVCPVFERFLGDQNGDGDTSDFNLAVFDLAAGSLHLTGWTVERNRAQNGTTRMVLRGERLWFLADERQLGDLNGDRDRDDQVLHRMNLRTHAVLNLGIVCQGRVWSICGSFGCVLSAGTQLAASSTFLAFARSERQDGLDHSGDGDREDHVLFLLDLATGVVTNTRVPVYLFAFVRERLLVQVPEEEWGSDRNGDGDLRDNVLAIFDPKTGTLTNTGIAQASEGDSFNDLILVDDGFAACVVFEFASGRDLDGDGEVGYATFLFDDRAFRWALGPGFLWHGSDSFFFPPGAMGVSDVVVYAEGPIVGSRQRLQVFDPVLGRVFTPEGVEPSSGPLVRRLGDAFVYRGRDTRLRLLQVDERKLRAPRAGASPAAGRASGR